MKKKVDTIVLDARPGKGVEYGFQLPRQTLDVDNLIAACTQKLSVDPTHEKALFIRASSFVKRGMFDEAIADCNKLMDMNPHNPNAFYVRGTAYERLGELEMSLQDFSHVLDLDPTHVNAAYSRAAAENRRGNYFQAIADYNLALKLDSREAMDGGGLTRKAMQFGLESAEREEDKQAANTSMN